MFVRETWVNSTNKDQGVSIFLVNQPPEELHIRKVQDLAGAREKKACRQGCLVSLVEKKGSSLARGPRLVERRMNVKYIFLGTCRMSRGLYYHVWTSDKSCWEGQVTDELEAAVLRGREGKTERGWDLVGP